jgi:glycosyltransferase involved in cell wall biosynthesis
MSIGYPLLSVCIPTFNRAELLELCLETVLPQLTGFQNEVECVISDNASSDRTSDILATYSAQYPVRISRNEVNIGIIANITKCASELAHGEFVLLIGDDDAMCAGAIQKILKVLRAPDAPDLVALNVGYLPRSERPTATNATGGVPATAIKTLRQSTAEGLVRFDELLEGPCADCDGLFG